MIVGETRPHKESSTERIKRKLVYLQVGEKESPPGLGPVREDETGSCCSSALAGWLVENGKIGIT